MGGRSSLKKNPFSHFLTFCEASKAFLRRGERNIRVPPTIPRICPISSVTQIDSDKSSKPARDLSSQSMCSADSVVGKSHNHTKSSQPSLKRQSRAVTQQLRCFRTKMKTQPQSFSRGTQTHTVTQSRRGRVSKESRAVTQHLRCLRTQVKTQPQSLSRRTQTHAVTQRVQKGCTTSSWVSNTILDADHTSAAGPARFASARETCVTR
jgi:hypothetical protein